MRRVIGWLIFLALIGAGYFYGRDYVRRHPQDFPWTKLDLRDPTGAFTGPKLARLGGNPAECRTLLRTAGVDAVRVPPRRAGPNCGYEDGMRLSSDPIRFSPAGPVTSCSVATGLHLLETRVIQPAAMRHLGSRVVVIDHAGSYSCRRLYGRSEGAFSEHATADAIDIIGFRLADGTRVSVLRDWDSDTPKAEFLRDVRDGSCRLFSTVLSPDYNAAHADHLHLDQAERGTFGWRACR
jgi:hypothetical protein